MLHEVERCLMCQVGSPDLCAGAHREAGTVTVCREGWSGDPADLLPEPEPEATDAEARALAWPSMTPML